MATVAPTAFTTQDLVYLRHGDRDMAMRLFKPEGNGPFPVVLNLHGGAWCNGDLNECRQRDEAIASAGMASAAIDFRHAGDGYPTSLIDINYALRWLKAQAGELGLDAEHVAIAGQSSGGHLAMLSAMRHEHAAYRAVELSGSEDATVRCVGMTWPVMNPFSRYRHALRERARPEPPAWAGDIPERHDLYWKNEANMSEGNPMLALERGEAVATPPAIWIQGTPDPVHDYLDPDCELGVNEPERFAARYREAGGSVEVVYIEQSDRANLSLAPLTAFLSKHLLG